MKFDELAVLIQKNLNLETSDGKSKSWDIAYHLLKTIFPTYCFKLRNLQHKERKLKKQFKKKNEYNEVNH